MQGEIVAELLSHVLGLLGLLVILAYLIEAIVEALVAQWLWYDQPEKKELRARVLKAVTSGVGVVVTCIFGVDLFGEIVGFFDGVTPVSPVIAVWVGRVLTGLLIGRGSQWLHDLGSNGFGLDQFGRVPTLSVEDHFG